MVAGDTAVIPYGQGGFASRQTITAGSAVHLAALTVRDKALKVAAHLLEASVEDLGCATAAPRSPASGQRAVAARDRRGGVGRAGYAMPGGFEPGLESMESFLPSALTYGMGAHAVEAEVDVETGGVRILRYVVVNDSGTVINPMIVEGQLVGGAVLASATRSRMVNDDDAQPLTTAIRRLPAGERDRGTWNVEVKLAGTLPAQSARRQGRGRGRLRGGPGRDRAVENALRRSASASRNIR